MRLRWSVVFGWAAVIVAIHLLWPNSHAWLWVLLISGFCQLLQGAL